MTEKINPADAIRLLDAHEAVAVDVREPDEYAVDDIPAGKHTAAGSGADPRSGSAAGQERRVAGVLPHRRRSADAVQKLESLGYTNLRDLGGILSWPYEIEGDFEGHF